MNILYLENHAVFADQVTRQFLAAHRVTVVLSLAAARTSLASGSYDLVLSDFAVRFPPGTSPPALAGL